MRKLNVAIVVENFHTGGGVERRTSELVKGLLSAGHEVHVYANRCEPNAAHGAHFHFIPILKLGRAMKPLSFAWFCSTMIRSSKHDLVHTQARIFRYDVATLGVGCHRAYLDAVGIDPTRAPDRWFHRAVLYIERSMLAANTNSRIRIILNSNRCKAELVNYYGVSAESIAVVRNGVDHAVFSPESRSSLRSVARAELDISPEESVVLFVGSGFQRKGLDTLIEAAGHLQDKSALKLLIVGRGRRDEYAKLAADLGLEERLIWVGRADSSDMARFYAAADMFALPTRYDPFANSTMEALACGVSVVTTSANGVSEILEDGVDTFIVEPGDVEALSERLATLTDDADLRQRLGLNGCKAVEPYTWQRTTEQTMAVYEAMLPGGGAT